MQETEITNLSFLKLKMMRPIKSGKNLDRYPPKIKSSLKTKVSLTLSSHEGVKPNKFLLNKYCIYPSNKTKMKVTKKKYVNDLINFELLSKTNHKTKENKKNLTYVIEDSNEDIILSENRELMHKNI